jgi:hypothetical protein
MVSIHPGIARKAPNSSETANGPMLDVHFSGDCNRLQPSASIEFNRDRRKSFVLRMTRPPDRIRI